MDPIELQYDDQESIPEAVRGLYSQQGDKFILTGVNGMKTQRDIDNVQEALRKERTDRKSLEDQLKPFKNLNAEDVLKKLDRFDELEAAAGDKLDDEKINKIVEGRLKQATAPLQRQVEDLTGQLTEVSGERDAFKGTITDMKMTSAIRREAQKAKVLGSAIPDVEIIARNAFELTDTGDLITKDNAGVTPGIGLEAYFREMQETRPHWWPQSEGGGAGGGRTKMPNGEANPWTAANWNMTKQGAIVRENPELASQLAKSAGTTVGGQKPKPKS